MLRSDEEGRTWVSVSDPVRRFPRSHRRRHRRGTLAAPQVDSFPDVISVESDDDDDSALASVASAHEAFVLPSVLLGSVDGIAPDVTLDPEVKLECDPEPEGAKPLSDSAEPISCFPVVRAETVDFSRVFLSCLQRPMSSDVRLWVPASVRCRMTVNHCLLPLSWIGLTMPLLSPQRLQTL